MIISYRRLTEKEIDIFIEMRIAQLRQKPDDYIDVDVDVAELTGTSAETKATYDKIKNNEFW